MKKTLLLFLMIFISVNSFAKDIIKINNFIISDDLINKSILSNSKNKILFNDLPLKDKNKLIITIIKAKSIYDSEHNKTSNLFKQYVLNKNITFHILYNSQLKKLSSKANNNNVFLIQKYLLFYTYWTMATIQQLSLNMVISNKQLKNTYDILNKKNKFNMPETRQFIYVQSNNKKAIEKLILEFNNLKNKNNFQTLQKFLFKFENLPDYKVIYKLNNNIGVKKDVLEKNFANLIWNMKTNEYTKKPIKYKNLYFFIFMTKSLPPHKISFEDIKDKLLEINKKALLSIKIKKIIVKDLKKEHIIILNKK